LEPEELHVRPPAEVAELLGLPQRDTRTVARVLKAFYGISNAPRLFWLDICGKLKAKEWQRQSWDKSVWTLYEYLPKDRQANSHGWKLVGLIVTHVDDFLIAGDLQSQLYLDMRLWLQGAYRWGKWELGITVFAGVRVRQLQNFEFETDMEEYVEKNTAEIVLTAERKKRGHDNATAEECSLFRAQMGVLQWCTTQIFLQFAVNVSMLLSSSSELRVEHLLEGNSLSREVRKQKAQKLRFSNLGHPAWTTVGATQYVDASQGNRPRGHSTGGMVTLMTGEDFRLGKEAPASLMGWRSFRLPRKVLGSNGGEAQVFTFGERRAMVGAPCMARGSRRVADQDAAKRHREGNARCSGFRQPRHLRRREEFRISTERVEIGKVWC
jgi:hypothetical protein